MVDFKILSFRPSDSLSENLLNDFTPKNKNGKQMPSFLDNINSRFSDKV